MSLSPHQQRKKEEEKLRDFSYFPIQLRQLPKFKLCSDFPLKKKWEHSLSLCIKVMHTAAFYCKYPSFKVFPGLQITNHKEL
jgi:hypothetical protein